jgi:hypothetical protein
VIDVRSDAAVADYPIPRWWDTVRYHATQPRAQTPSIDHQVEQEPIQGGNPVAGLPVVSDVVPAISAVSFWVPDYICPSAWIEHAPFAFWICEALQPRCFVELGTHFGYSYFAFCQAIDRLRLGTTAYAIDTWKGDEHAGFYDESVFQSVTTRNNDKYAAFSCLIRSTFEGALDYFTDGSIDLLHIDGRHFYEDIERDFTLWHAKLSENAVVLFHDTNVRERNFGVWKFFEKVAAQHPSFQFFHGYGLGVLIPGDRVPAPLAPILEASRETAREIRAAYAALGGALTVRAALGERRHEIEVRNVEYAQSLAEIERLKAPIETIVRERDQAVSILTEPHREIEAQKAEYAQSLAEIERLKVVIETTVSERDQAINALTERHRKIEAQNTEYAQLLGETESLKTLIATTVRERDEAIAALAAGFEALASSRASLAERDDALAAMSRRADELEAALASADENLAKRRDALSRAEREVSDQNAALKGLQSEITALRRTLAASQDVGRAALAALRTAPATIPDAPSLIHLSFAQRISRKTTRWPLVKLARGRA